MVHHKISCHVAQQTRKLMESMICHLTCTKKCNPHLNLMRFQSKKKLLRTCAVMLQYFIVWQIIWGGEMIGLNNTCIFKIHISNVAKIWKKCKCPFILALGCPVVPIYWFLLSHSMRSFHFELMWNEFNFTKTLQCSHAAISVWQVQCCNAMQC